MGHKRVMALKSAANVVLLWVMYGANNHGGLLCPIDIRYEREDVNIVSGVELEEYVSPRRHSQARVKTLLSPVSRVG
jgi:hypothetical protein